MEYRSMQPADAQFFKLQSEICKTLAYPKRLMILHQLRGGEMSVGQIVSSLGLPQANVSQHLAIMRERGIVTTRREGTSIYYSLVSRKIGEACDLVRQVLEDQLAGNRILAGSIASAAGEVKSTENKDTEEEVKWHKNILIRNWRKR
jgi:DNA-binding transcriptional ArsR family regulator